MDRGRIPTCARNSPRRSTNTYLCATAVSHRHPEGNDKRKANANSNTFKLMQCAKLRFASLLLSLHIFALVSSLAVIPSFYISPVPFPFLIIFPGPWAAAQFQHSILWEIIFWHGSVILFDFNFIVNVETAQQP